jgi:hypothetical protein
VFKEYVRHIKSVSFKNQKQNRKFDENKNILFLFLEIKIHCILKKKHISCLMDSQTSIDTFRGKEIGRLLLYVCHVI